MSEVLKDFSANIDLKETLVFEPIKVVEGDNGNVLVLNIVKDGDPVDLTDCLVQIVFAHSGRTVWQDSSSPTGGITISGDDNNIVTVRLHSDSYAPNGITVCQVKVYSGTGQTTLVSSSRFSFKAELSLLNAETVESIEQYSILVTMIETVNGMLDRDQADWDETDTLKVSFVRNKPVADIDAHASRHLIGGADALNAMPYDAISSNLLINECFDFWPEGTTFVNPANSKYTADGWMTGLNTADGGTYPTITISKTEYIPHPYPSRNFFKFSTNGAGSSLGANSLYVIRQKIEQGTRLYAGYGNKITVSFLAYTTIPGKKIGVRLVQRYGTGGSPSASEVIAGAFFTLSGNPTVYSHTFTLNTKAGKTFGTNPDDMIDVDFVYMWGASQASNVGASAAETFVGAGEVYTVWAQVNPGDAALPLVPRPFEIGLALCERYYEKSYDLSVAPGTANVPAGLFCTTVMAVAIANGSRWFLGSHPTFKVRKRIPPTMLLYDYSGAAGTWQIPGGMSRACSAIANEHGFIALNATGGTVTPVALEAFGHWVADARLY